MSYKNIRRSFIGSSSITIGRYTYGDQNIAVHQWNEGAPLVIGAFCSIAENIHIFLGGNHRIDWITTFPFGHIFSSDFGGQDIPGHPSTHGGVFIGSDVWIGYGATIMSGITIGDGAVIAANSTVTKNVLPYQIVGGNPACHIKFRFSNEIVNLLLQLKWWELSIDIIKKLTLELSKAPDSSKLKELIKIHR